MTEGEGEGKGEGEGRGEWESGLRPGPHDSVSVREHIGAFAAQEADEGDAGLIRETHGETGGA